MRAKSETKRQAIIDVAAQVFRELGFERTSMSEICARVGGSKATLYNHFTSKEALFFEVMFQSLDGEFRTLYTCLDDDYDDIADGLHEFGTRFLRLLFSPEMMPIRRLVIAESARSELGRLVYEHGPRRNHEILAGFLKRAMARGQLRDADASVAAWHLSALMQSELLDRLLMCVQESASDEEIESCVLRAIDVFMRAYGPVSA